MSAHVVITYRPGEAEQVVIAETLHPMARISFLPEVPGSQQRTVLEAADVLLGMSLSAREIDPGLIPTMERLRLIQLVFSGADRIDFTRVPENVVIACNPGAFAQPIAEHVLAMTLALAKRLLPNHQRLARGEFAQDSLNKAITNRVCGILGLGGNGLAVARIMTALGLQVYGINRSGISPGSMDFLGTMDDLPLLLRESDILVLTLPLNRQTRGLIGAREMEQMKPEAILVNVGRGDLIVQKDLFRHLQRHPDFGAGIDTWWVEPGTHGVFRLDFPFFELSNVIGSPHNADDVPGAMTAATQQAVDNVRKYLLGRDILGRVDRMDYQM